jgi:nicotinate phosphoribosyltransferase
MIPSLLDTDLYKLTMQQAVRVKAPRARARYEYINRGRSTQVGDGFLRLAKQRIHDLATLSLAPEERKWLARTGWFGEDYLEYLETYRFDPAEVSLERDSAGNLSLVVEGPWQSTILWEVPLLALLSQTWYETEDTAWNPDLRWYFEHSRKKGRKLIEAGCAFSDFGTRRRRSLSAQQAMLLGMQSAAGDAGEKAAGSFAGTSNLHFARQMDLTPIGTVAHEWTMGCAALYGVAQADRRAMEDWLDVYPDEFKIALSDTYTTDHFLKNFDQRLAQEFAGVRHDSGNPEVFIEKVLERYADLGIDARQKTLVFSDGLDEDNAAKIEQAVANRANTAYGIGTYLTNDFPHGEALDIVIKLTSLNGHNIAKISDEPDKATGEPEAVREARQAIGS